MTDYGPEWLGRLVIEPRRLWRRYTSPAIPSRAACGARSSSSLPCHREYHREYSTARVLSWQAWR